MSTLTATQLQQQYIAYFGRPGDPAGIKYWLSSSSGISSAREFADKIYAQEEYKQSTVGSKSTEEQINGLYVNLFGRQADAAGLLYWTNEVEKGVLSLSNIAYDLIAAASAPVSGNESQAALDAQALSNKVAAATSYTADVEASTSAILAYQPESTTPWVTGSAFTAGVTFLATATAANAPTAADVASSVSTMSTASPASEGTAYTLTANTDNISGTTGDDTITGSNATFNSDDTINGGAGSDTVTITTTVSSTGTIGNFTDVETVKITNGAAAGQDYILNVIGATGVTEYNSRLSTGQVTFSNIQSPATVTAYGTQSGSETTALFLNSLTTGTADSINLKLDGGATTTFQVNGTTPANEFEIINIESAGSIKNTVTAIQDSGAADLSLAEKYVVTGSADLDITIGTGKAKATYDGSAATGNQKVVWTNAGTTTVTTGSGDDTIDASAGAFFGNTNPKAVDGGTGSDTLTLSETVSTLDTTSSTTDHSVTGIEVLELKNTLANGGSDITQTVAVDKIAGFTTLKITGDNNDTTADGGNGEAATEDLRFVVTGLGANQNVTFTSDTSDSAATNISTLSLKLKTDTGLSDVLNIESAQPAAGKVNDWDTFTIDRVVASADNAIETVNFTSSAVDVGSTDGTTIESFVADYSTTVNLLGTGDLKLTQIGIADPAGSTTAMLDASAMTGNLTTGAAFKKDAADTLTIKLGSGTNTVDLGAEVLAADVVTGSTGTDTVKIIDINAALGTTTTGLTLTDIDVLEVKGENTAGANAISAANFTNVGVIKIYDAAGDSDANQAGADDANSANDDVSISNISAGQKFEIHSTADNADFDGATVTLDLATGNTSALDVTLAGDYAFEATAKLTTDATSLNLTDKVQTTTGTFTTQALVLDGTSSTAKLGTLTVDGGGSASGTVQTLSLTGTNNVDIATLDASGLVSHLTISGLTTKAGSKITLGSGDNTLTVAESDLLIDAVNIDGGDGTDTVVAASLDASTSYRPGTTNVEKLDLDILDTQTGAVTIDGNDSNDVTTIRLRGGASGNQTDANITIEDFDNLSTLEVQGYFGDNSTEAVSIDDTGATTVITKDITDFSGDQTPRIATLTFSDATSLLFKLGSTHTAATSTELHLGNLTANKATSITLGGQDAGTNGVQYIGEIETTSLTANALTTLTIDSNQGDITLPSVTAAKLTTITASGDNVLTLTDGTTTALTSLDASGQTGAVTVGAGIDLKSGGDVKLGTAADTITIDVVSEGNVSIDAGEKSGTDVVDTLLITGANNLGLTVVDLSAADQITQLNGGINSAVQQNIERLELNGLTGSHGASIIGSPEANYIYGTINADTIDLTETTQKIDTIEYKFDGGGLAESRDNDIITGFVPGSGGDVIAIQAVDAATFASDDGNTDDLTGSIPTNSFGVIADHDLSANANSAFTSTASVIGEFVGAGLTIASISTDAFRAVYGVGGNEVVEGAAAGALKMLFVAYDSTNTSTANAGLFYVDIATDGNGNTGDVSTIEVADLVDLVATFNNVGYGSFTADNFAVDS